MTSPTHGLSEPASSESTNVSAQESATAPQISADVAERLQVLIARHHAQQLELLREIRQIDNRMLRMVKKTVGGIDPERLTVIENLHAEKCACLAQLDDHCQQATDAISDPGSLSATVVGAHGPAAPPLPDGNISLKTVALLKSVHANVIRGMMADASPADSGEDSSDPQPGSVPAAPLKLLF